METKRKIRIAVRWLALALIVFVPVYAATYYFAEGNVFHNPVARAFVIFGFLSGLLAAVYITDIRLDLKKAPQYGKPIELIGITDIRLPDFKKAPQHWKPIEVIGYAVASSFACPGPFFFIYFLFMAYHN